MSSSSSSWSKPASSSSSSSSSANCIASIFFRARSASTSNLAHTVDLSPSASASEMRGASGEPLRETMAETVTSTTWPTSTKRGTRESRMMTPVPGVPMSQMAPNRVIFTTLAWTTWPTFKFSSVFRFFKNPAARRCRCFWALAGSTFSSETSNRADRGVTFRTKTGPRRSPLRTTLLTPSPLKAVASEALCGSAQPRRRARMGLSRFLDRGASCQTSTVMNARPWPTKATTLDPSRASPTLRAESGISSTVSTSSTSLGGKGDRTNCALSSREAET
mmetsp:Transcript_32133/g.111057  ORF Transcript_32133/g.111057 Transcript_32133/m.111057 type:complete len:277 (-) Transcript_32133:472-1302(-)